MSDEVRTTQSMAGGGRVLIGDNSLTNGLTNCRLWPAVQTATTAQPVNPLAQWTPLQQSVPSNTCPSPDITDVLIASFICHGYLEG